jgi:hypothetical protein
MVVIERHDLVRYRNKRFSTDENAYSLQRTGFTCFLVKGMVYGDRNGDGKKEFVVRGTYKGVSRLRNGTLWTRPFGPSSISPTKGEAY